MIGGDGFLMWGLAGGKTCYWLVKSTEGRARETEENRKKQNILNKALCRVHMSILEAGQFLLSDWIFPECLIIYFDIQAVIRSPTNILSTSILVYECRELLTEIWGLSNVTLSWVPKHTDIAENCIAMN